MKLHHLSEMTKGWFVGDFEPSVIRSKDTEVGVKHYVAGDYEKRHVHKIATEITLIVSGTVEMDGHSLGPGDIAVIAPGEAVDFRVLTDTTTVVVKTPSVIGDKYEV